MVDPDQADFPPPAPVVQHPAADVRAPGVGEGTQVTYTYPIRQPEEDFNDFQVGVRASLLKRCRTRLHSISQHSFPVSDVLLGASTLAIGATLSAFVSGVELSSWRGAVFFIAFPLVAMGSGVAYAMSRGAIQRSAQNIAEDILNDLPDPDRTVDVR